MKFKLQKKTVIISGIVAVLCVAGVCTALVLTRDRGKALAGTYPVLSEIAIHAFFDERGGCAYHTEEQYSAKNAEELAAAAYDALRNVELKVTFNCADENALQLDALPCVTQTEKAAHKYFGNTTVAANKGGVSFDIIE